MKNEELIEQIKRYNKLREQTEIEKIKLDRHFQSIFEAIHEIQENNWNKIGESFMGNNYFGKYSTYDGFKYQDNKIYLHYYDYGYDCYDCCEFCIPVEAAESEESAKKWAEKEVEKKIKEREKKRKEAEKRKEENEKAEYERLKKKYEG